MSRTLDGFSSSRSRPQGGWQQGEEVVLAQMQDQYCANVPTSSDAFATAVRYLPPTRVDYLFRKVE